MSDDGVQELTVEQKLDMVLAAHEELAERVEEILEKLDNLNYNYNEGFNNIDN